MKSNRMAIICGIVGALVCISSTFAQEPASTPTPTPSPTPAPTTEGRESRREGRGNFDPAQFQQRMMDSIKDRLGFKDDAEWTAVQPLVQKVMDLRRETMMGGMRFGRSGGRRSGGESASTSSTQSNTERSRNSWFTPSPEAGVLQKAIDDNTPPAQIKAALEKYHTAKRDKEAKLATAQEDLRKVLTVRQEAQATLMGLLP